MPCERCGGLGRAEAAGEPCCNRVGAGHEHGASRKSWCGALARLVLHIDCPHALRLCPGPCQVEGVSAEPCRRRQHPPSSAPPHRGNWCGRPSQYHMSCPTRSVVTSNCSSLVGNRGHGAPYSFLFAPISHPSLHLRAPAMTFRSESFTLYPKKNATPSYSEPPPPPLPAPLPSTTMSPNGGLPRRPPSISFPLLRPPQPPTAHLLWRLAPSAGKSEVQGCPTEQVPFLRRAVLDSRR